MTVIYEAGYSLPSGDQPLTHARIAHSLNWLSGGTVSASSTATGYFADAPTNTLTYERWKPTGSDSKWEYDHGSAVQCDYWAIAAHTLGTNGNEVYAQYYDDGLSTWRRLAPTTAITTDEPIMGIFEPVTAQRWRIKIPTGSAPEVGVIKFGSALQMERPLYGGHAPISTARQTLLRSNYSETGEFLGRSKQRTYLSTQYDWQHLTETWVRANWPTFQLATEAEPFFIAWRPDRLSDVAFCQLDEVPIPSNMGIKAYMEVSMQVRARGYN